MLTTTEAAALLTERGLTDTNGGSVRAETVKRWCLRKKFPGARSIGGRIWQIPREDVEAFKPGKPGRPKAND